MAETATTPESMQTHYVILDPREDAASLRAKLDSITVEKTVIVAPADVRGLRSPLVLRVLERFLSTYRGQARLVAQDQEVRSVAASLGIRTAGSLPRSLLSKEQVADIEETLRSERRSTYWLRANPFLPRIAAVIIGVLFFLIVLLPFAAFLPSATVTIPVATETLEEERLVQLVRTTGQPAPGSDLFPAERREVRFEVQAFAATDEADSIPAGAATGMVNLSNETGEPVGVPARTSLDGPGNWVFLTRDDVTVPPSGQASVAVFAERPGAEGNAPARTITRFSGESPFNQTLAVTNPEPMQGGASVGPNVITADDQSRLREEAMRRIAAEAAGQLHGSLGEGEILIGQSIASALVGERFSHGLGDLTEEFSLTADAVAAGWVVNEPLLTQFARDILAGQGNARLLAGSERVEILDAHVEIGGEEVALLLRLAAAREPEVNLDGLREDLTGLSVDEAQELVARRLPLRGPPDIVIEPDWLAFGTMPRFDWRIRLEVEIN